MHANGRNTRTHKGFSVARLLSLVVLASSMLASFLLDEVPAVEAQGEGMGTQTGMPIKAQLQKLLHISGNVTTRSSDICMIEGTVQISSQGINAIRLALSMAASEVNFNGAECFAPVDLRDEGEWQLISLVGVVGVHPGDKWYVSSNGVWMDNVILHAGSGKIEAAVAGTQFFSQQLAVVPNEVFSQDVKKALDPLSPHIQELSPTEPYIFPLENGRIVKYGSLGVHKNEFHVVMGDGSMAVDLLSDGDTAQNHAPNIVLAVASGEVVKRCSDTSQESTYIKIQHADGTSILYGHLLAGSAPENGTQIHQGDSLGVLKTGPFVDGTCGYAKQGDNEFHVHLEIPNTPSLTLGNWTLDTASGVWTNGSEVWSPGEWKQIGGGGNNVPLLTLNLGSILGNRQIRIIAQRSDGFGRILEPDHTWFTASDANGNIINFPLIGSYPRNEYYLLVKPQGWLQKKSLITLAAGPNTSQLDFMNTCNGNAHGCAGDLDENNKVNIVDVGLMVDHYGTANPLYDLNRDGTVNIVDIGLVTDAYDGTGSEGAGGASAVPVATSAAATGTGSLALAVPQVVAIGSQTVNALQVGQVFTLDLNYDTGGLSIDGADAVIDYDQCVLEPIEAGIIRNDTFPTTSSFVRPGTLEYSAHMLLPIGSGFPVSGSGNLAAIPFKVIAGVPSTTKVTIRFRPNSTYYGNMIQDKTLSQILGSVTNVVLSPTGSPNRPARSAQVTIPVSKGMINDNFVLLQAQASDPCGGLHQVIFNVYYDGAWHEVGTDTDGTDGWSMYWDAGQIADQVVRVKAFASDFAGNGVTTAVNTGITLDRQAPSITNLTFDPTAAAVGELVNINLNLTDNLSGVKRVDLYVDPSTDGSTPWPWDLIGTVNGGAGVVQWNTAGYAAGAHQVVLVTEDNAGNQGFWPLAEQTPLEYQLGAAPLPPSPPSPFGATKGFYADKVLLSWGSSSGATRYEIWRNLTDASSSATRIADSVTGMIYSDFSASPGTTYYYWVKACNASACSDFSISDYGFRLITSTGNMLINSSFELDANNDGKPDTWTTNAKFTRSNAIAAQDGAYVGRFSAADNSGATIQQVVPNLAAGSSYDFAGWVNIPATSDAFTFKIQVKWRNASNSAISTQVIKTYTTSTNGQWNEAAASLVAPAGTTNALVQMVVSSLNATIYVDKFSFQASGSSPTTYTLTVNKTGTGSGNVTSSPAGVNCGSDCSEPYASGTAVLLTATAAAGSSFTGWTGDADCSDGQVSMNADKACTANFTLTSTSNDLLKNGSFEEDSNTDGKPDTWTTNAKFTRSSAITAQDGTYIGRFLATDNTGATIQETINNLAAGKTYNFSGWVNIPATSDAFTLKIQVKWRNASNAAISTKVIKSYTASTNGWNQATASLVAPAGTTNALVQMVVSNLNATIYVDKFSFQESGSGPTTYMLTVNKGGTGNGTITSSPAGINCGADCSEPYNSGQVVVLAATADSGSTFTGWSGAGCAGTGTCSVTMNAATSVTAGFDTVISSDLIFANSFEDDDCFLTQWSSCVDDAGDLNFNGPPLIPSGFGISMSILLDDNHAAYVTSDHPNAETHYRSSFYFDPNSMAMVSGDTHVIFGGYSGASTLVLRLQFRKSSGNYQLQASLLQDDSVWNTSSWFTITDAPHLLEMDWSAATSPGANNGTLVFSIDGVQKVNKTATDNDTWRIDSARLGAVAGIDTGTRGTYYFDEFESRR